MYVCTYIYQEKLMNKHLQVHVQLEYLRKHSQNVSELVVAEGLDTALRHNDIIDLSNVSITQ